MSEEFRDVTNWAAVVGLWELSNGRCVYTSPDETLGHPQLPHGICIRFSEGTARATIRFSKEGEGSGVTGEGRLLFGYRSPADHYVTVGLGGHGRAYTVSLYEPAVGWRGAAFAGSPKNLIAYHPYKVSVRVQGQRVLLEVDSVQVLEHVLETPLPQGQLGLFTWGSTSVEFTAISASEEPGTVFVVMQFSDPYHDLYTDVISRVIKDYKLRAYHAGEVFGPGVIVHGGAEAAK